MMPQPVASCHLTDGEPRCQPPSSPPREENTMFGLTSAQIHLAVNHLPVITALLASATLLLAALTRGASLRNTGCALLVVAGLSALPAYFSGEGAEEIVEHRPGVSESLVEQ